MLLEASQRPKQLISLTPLIDVVFILLLFFMLSSTFSHSQQIELKTASAGEKQPQTGSVNAVQVNENKIILSGVSYHPASAEFNRELAELVTDNKPVYLAAAPDVEIQQLISLIDQIREAGISNLTLRESVAL